MDGPCQVATGKLKVHADDDCDRLLQQQVLFFRQSVALKQVASNARILAHFNRWLNGGNWAGKPGVRIAKLKKRRILPLQVAQPSNLTSKPGDYRL